MAAPRGLLSRMEAGEGPGARSDDPSEAIVAHLRSVLNTRRGGCATQPSFGVVDFTDLVHGFPHSIPALQQAIRATILEFEPRLKNVTVRHVPQDDPLVLRFEITAQPAHKGARGLLRFSTQMHPGGKMEVW